MALGLIPGWRQFRKFGMNDSVSGSSVRQDVWPIGTPRVLPTSAGALAVVSTSAEDDENEATPPGTGAWTLVVEGLDSNYVEIIEAITMTGTTPAASSGSDWFRVNRAYVGTLDGTAASGTNQANVGDITVSIGGAAQAFVEANESQTHQCMYTVPATDYLIVEQYRWTLGRMSGATDCQVSGEIQLFGQNTWRYISDVYGFGPEVYANDDGVTVIPPKTEVRMQTLSSGATQVTGIFAGYLLNAAVLSKY